MTIYLSEKGLLSSPNITTTLVKPNNLSGAMEALGKPPGTVPILSLGDGRYIKQSLAILEYFEDICDEYQMKRGKKEESENNWLEQANLESLRGGTALERARMREIVGLVEEATTFFVIAAHKGTAVFTGVEEQNPITSRLALESCKMNLQKVEEYYLEREERKGDKRRDHVTLADIVLFCLLQFAKEHFGVDLIDALESLRTFYEWFEKRESARIEEGFYPVEFRSLAQTWLKEECDS